MNIDLTLDLISFGIYSGKGFWTVNLGARSIISASIPKSMFELARYANTNPELDANVNLNYDITDMALHANIFTEIGLGYSRPVTKDLTVGGRVQLLVGLGNLDAKIDQIYAHVNTDDLASYQSWKVKTKGRLEASMKGLEFSYNSDSGYIEMCIRDSLVHNLNHGFPAGLVCQRIPVYFDKTVDKVNRGSHFFHPFDRVTVKPGQISCLVVPYQPFNYLFLVLVASVFRRFFQVVRDAANLFPVFSDVYKRQGV